jgi:chorismate mutase
LAVVHVAESPAWLPTVSAGLDLAPVRPQRRAAMTESAPIETPAELVELRHSIDNIDAAVIHLLAERFKCTRKVGELKAKLTMPPADPMREAQQIARLRSLAVTADLDPEFAEKFLNFLVKEVIRHHEIIREKHSA